ncbi:MAG: hypothetical protein ACPG4N_05930 [Gammaproteobacteria bacterium]
MSRKQIKSRLGESLVSEERGYRHYYDVCDARVELDFSHYVDSGDEDDAYKLEGITITTE